MTNFNLIKFVGKHSLLEMTIMQRCRYLSCFSASLTRPHRLTYKRLYPTVVVNPDGSSYKIPYPEPRQIIKLPLNVWTLSEAERKARLDLRKPKKKVKFVDDIQDSYDANKYLKYVKTK